MSLKIYLEIIRKNLLEFFKIPILACMGILVVTYLFFPTAGLDIFEVCKMLEMFVSFTGLAALTLLFLPEQDKNVYESVACRKVSVTAVVFVRVVIGILILCGFIFGFCAFLKHNECAMSFEIIRGTIASAFFLGSLGFLVAGITGNTINGLLVGIIYYICNYGLKNKLGVFFLFGMSADDFTGKKWLMMGGILLLAAYFMLTCVGKIKAGMLNRLHIFKR